MCRLCAPVWRSDQRRVENAALSSRLPGKRAELGAPCVSNYRSIDAHSVCSAAKRPRGWRSAARLPPGSAHAASYPAEETNDGFQRDDSRGPFSKQARGRRVNRASGWKRLGSARRRTWPEVRELWHGGIMWHCESRERPASHPAALARSPQKRTELPSMTQNVLFSCPGLWLLFTAAPPPPPPFYAPSTHSHPPHLQIHSAPYSNLLSSAA